jgi:hypothetical protein
MRGWTFAIVAVAACKGPAGSSQPDAPQVADAVADAAPDAVPDAVTVP